MTGPGSQLQALLSAVGIRAAETGCRCRSRAGFMDRQGPDWCERNIDTIVGWLRDEAKKRGIPFVDMAGRQLVRVAIARARRAAGGLGRPAR